MTANTSDCGSSPDLSRLHALMQSAGPAVAAELLQRLISDLQGAARDLGDALACRDRAALRAVTHILISVAGAVGDMRLSDLARQLNGLAGDPQADPGELAPRVTCSLRTLLAAINGLRDTGLRDAGGAA